MLDSGENILAAVFSSISFWEVERPQIRSISNGLVKRSANGLPLDLSDIPRRWSPPTEWDKYISLLKGKIYSQSFEDAEAGVSFGLTNLDSQKLRLEKTLAKKNEKNTKIKNWSPLSSIFHVEQPETLIEWKFESITDGRTNLRTDMGRC